MKALASCVSWAVLLLAFGRALGCGDGGQSLCDKACEAGRDVCVQHATRLDEPRYARSAIIGCEAAESQCQIECDYWTRGIEHPVFGFNPCMWYGGFTPNVDGSLSIIACERVLGLDPER